MGHHFLFRPIQHLAEAVEVLKVGHIPNRGQRVTLIVILDELEFGFSGFRVFAEVLTLLDDHNIQILVLAAA